MSTSRPGCCCPTTPSRANRSPDIVEPAIEKAIEQSATADGGAPPHRSGAARRYRGGASLLITIAFLGTGIMGAPMARNLASAGHEVTAWNRTSAKARGTRAKVAESPAEACEGAEVVITMLAVAYGRLRHGGSHPPVGGVWWQASTVGVEWIEATRFRLRRRAGDGHPQARRGRCADRARLRSRPRPVGTECSTRSPRR